MKNVKKYIAVLLLVALLLTGATACKGGGKRKSDKLSVVVTVFPAYDWVLNVLGAYAAEADVTLLLDSGVDLHSYQPTVNDMIAISTCDLFLYVGGESDGWVADALKSAKNPDRVVLNLLNVLGDAAKTEEAVEGMEAEEEGEEAEYDEHVWLSLRCAATFVGAIRDALSALDAPHAEDYAANAAAYTEKLNALDARYVAAVQSAARKTLLFADRFPFRYLTDDYGLSYYAAFSGCSAESEASFETVAFLAGKVDELSLPAVLTLEGSDRRIAETVTATAKKTGVKILALDSLQSTTKKDAQAGATYLAAMTKNLEVLTEALR